jgi:hypothetical protein
MVPHMRLLFLSTEQVLEEGAVERCTSIHSWYSYFKTIVYVSAEKRHPREKRQALEVMFVAALLVISTFTLSFLSVLGGMQLTSNNKTYSQGLGAYSFWS